MDEDNTKAGYSPEIIPTNRINTTKSAALKELKSGNSAYEVGFLELREGVKPSALMEPIKQLLKKKFS